MRYRLRTLLIFLAIGPPLLAGAWWGYGKWREEQERQEEERKWRPDAYHLPGEPVVDPEA